MADEVRKAYIDASLGQSRADALRNSEFYASQAEKAKADLVQLGEQKAKFEQATGVVLQDNNQDFDQEHMRALTSSRLPGVQVQIPRQIERMTAAQLDAAIDVASKTLGPNNPKFMALRAQRAAIADENARKSPAANATTLQEQNVAVANQMIEAQRSKILSQSDNLAKARAIQFAIARRRIEYTNASTRAAEFLTKSGGTQTGMAPLGVAEAPLAPKFPNKPFILGGTLVLGGMFGAMLTLFLEFLGRRVRYPIDLSAVMSAPLLAIVPNTSAKVGWLQRLRPRLPKLHRKILPFRRRAVEA